MGADGIDEFGLETTEVRAESTGRNLAIGIGGIVIVIAAAIPITWGLLTVGTATWVYGSIVLVGLREGAAL